MEISSDELYDLAKTVLTQCQMKNLTLAIVETSTGGFICHNLTNIDGSSKVFMGGLVVYSVFSKNSTLNVDYDIINTYGVLSNETTQALLDGCRKIIPADIIIAVSGLAGSILLEGKPRGYTLIGISYGQSWSRIEKFQFPGDRKAIKDQTTKKSFEMILEQLSNM